MTTFEESYLGQLRMALGDRKIITPGARGVIMDDAGRLLLVRRRDNRQWGMPAGCMELDESILGCLKREVREETGLEVLSATPFAMYTEPRFDFVNAHGGHHKMFVVAFKVEEWVGSLVTETDETVDARFFAMDEVPDYYRECLDDLNSFNGHLILK